MKLARSVVVALDGESKCGKTTIVDAIADEARYQTNAIPNLLTGRFAIGRVLSDELRIGLAAAQDQLAFDRITKISAGNAFRAAALYVMEEERRGISKTHFDLREDIDKIRELLRVEGIEDILQNDPEVGRRVTPVAQMAGVQALCGTVFCDAIQQAYNADGGANLVIVDARDPIGHMQRNNLLETYSPYIDPSRVLPMFVDTPTKVAAERLKGSFNDNFNLVRSRRDADATRTELPVHRPRVLIEDFDAWTTQFDMPSAEIAIPLRFYNGEGVSLDDVQQFAGKVAAAAQSIACFTYGGPLAETSARPAA